ncbi:hypothetical protein GCM10017687_34250 [Streptomyces echinatus]
MDESAQIIGVTSVPGGCVNVTPPWGYAPHMPGVLTRLSAGHLSATACTHQPQEWHNAGRHRP